MTKRWVITPGHAEILEVDEATFDPQLPTDQDPKPKKWYEFTWDGVLLETRGRNIFLVRADAVVALRQRKEALLERLRQKLIRTQRQVNITEAMLDIGHVRPAGLSWGNDILNKKMPPLHDGMHLILGPVCSGKTSFLINMVLANKDKGRILFISDDPLSPQLEERVRGNRNFYFVKTPRPNATAEEYLEFIDTFFWTPAWSPWALVLLDGVRMFGNPVAEEDKIPQRREIVTDLSDYRVPFIITEQVNRTAKGLPGNSAEARTALTSPWVGLAQSIVLLNLHARKQRLEILSTTGHIDVWRYKTPHQGQDDTL